MSVLVGMLIGGVHRGRGRRAARAAGAAARRHLPLARDVRVRVVLRQRHGEIHWVGGGNGITPVKAPRPLLGPIDFDATSKSFLVLCLVDPRDRRAARGLGARAARPVASSTRSRGSEVAAASIGINPTRVAHHRVRAVGRARRSRRRPAGDARAGSELRNPNFVAQLGLFWVVLVVSLGSRTVEGAIQAAVGFIFFQRVVLEPWIPWIVNHALGPVVLVITLIIVLRLITHRFVVLSAIAATFGIAFSSTTSSEVRDGRSTRCRPGSRSCSSASVRSRTPSTPKACSSSRSASRSRGRNAGSTRSKARARRHRHQRTAARRPGVDGLRRSERRDEPARRVGRHEDVRGHHRARPRRASTSANARSSGSSVRTARARRRSSTACSAS